MRLMIPKDSKLLIGSKLEWDERLKMNVRYLDVCRGIYLVIDANMGVIELDIRTKQWYVECEECNEFLSVKDHSIIKETFDLNNIDYIECSEVKL